MSVLNIDVKDIITQIRNQAMKEYYVYDGGGREIERYQAVTNAKHSGPCLKTSYEYEGATNRKIKMKEEVVPWDASWDI